MVSENPSTIVAKQAEDAGLWFLTATASEAYLQQELRRLHAAVEADGWQPIETAPRERWPIDIWVVDRKTGKGRRYADATWAPWDGKDAWDVADGSSRRWVTGLYYYDEEGERCCDPTRQDAQSAVATHWRPQPEPPK